MTSAEHEDGGHLSLMEQPVQVAVGCDDEEGCLIFADDRLVAVLVRLSQLHEELAGRWYLERGLVGWRDHTSPHSGISAQPKNGSPDT
jgi:hypothetical protein